MYDNISSNVTFDDLHKPSPKCTMYYLRNLDTYVITFYHVHQQMQSLWSTNSYKYSNPLNVSTIIINIKPPKVSQLWRFHIYWYVLQSIKVKSTWTCRIDSKSINTIIASVGAKCLTKRNAPIEVGDVNNKTKCTIIISLRE